MRGSDAVAWRVIRALPWILRNRAGMRAVGDRHRRNQTHASTPFGCFDYAQHKFAQGKSLSTRFMQGMVQRQMLRPA